MFSRAMQRMSDLIGLRNGSSYASRAERPARASSEYDAGWLWSALLLLAIGLVMVYSSSIAIGRGEPLHRQQFANYFLIRHVGVPDPRPGGGMSVFQVPMRVWQQAAPWLFIGGSVLLVLVLIPGLGNR